MDNKIQDSASREKGSPGKVAALWVPGLILGRINEILGVYITEQSNDSPRVAVAKGLAVSVLIGGLASAFGYFALRETYHTAKGNYEQQDGLTKWLVDGAVGMYNFFLGKADSIADSAIVQDASQKIDNVLKR